MTASQEDCNQAALWWHPSSRMLRQRLWILVLLVCALLYLLYLTVRSPGAVDEAPAVLYSAREKLQEEEWQESRMKSIGELTPLGKWLLSPEGTPPPKRTTNRYEPFLILDWQLGPFLERLHIRRFSSDKKYSPWADCSVSNCRLTYEPEDFDAADVMLVHLYHTDSAMSLPIRTRRDQLWVFLTDEAPNHTFYPDPVRQPSVADFDGVFNWSMSYRMTSDVPVPYGRAILAARRSSFAEHLKLLRRRRERAADPTTKLTCILASNCDGSNGRWKYVAELKKHLGDDLWIVGRCLDDDEFSCPGYTDEDYPALERCRFYLAFENSNCREYLTEKPYWQAYAKLTVPVVMGPPRDDCRRLLPPGSYLHVDDFAGPAELARRLRSLAVDWPAYEELHAWRTSYRLLNEHGYFGSLFAHYCRLCEALNYNSQEEKVYWRMEDFIDEKRDCSFNH